VFPEPEPIVVHGPARIAAVCNQKGGVGKTTTTINLGAALAEYGRRVLLVDFDPQGALSVGLGIEPQELDATVYNLLMERRLTARDVIIKTRVDGMDLMPSNIDLSGAEIQLVHEVAREFALGRVLQPVIPDYDVILIDCQPSLGRRAGSAGMRVFRATRSSAADGDHREGVQSAEPETCHRRPAGDHVRLPYLAHEGSAVRGRPGVRRPRLPHRHQPDGALP
jgi:hypothetical protein